MYKDTVFNSVLLWCRLQ